MRYMKQFNYCADYIYEEQRKEKTYFGLAPSVVAPGGTSNGQPLVHAHQVSGSGAMREKKVHTRQNGEFQAVLRATDFRNRRNNQRKCATQRCVIRPAIAYLYSRIVSN